ncbi:MAG: rhomboid family intramembrane serine protease [Phycisphaerales bacterium]|jgi:membrane associated rhomboid family serine protease|nr:rhomboid family intramembrane serine protease [Phycisphaerales bacterium]MDP7087099.1 rhomboid family intramembrane serine protease [Phycisphaerales bacterium]MDP7189047.1 rhomboid family intramembrane serine protease [Phycisphaerales bacterium]MDP7519764.1 rhomboid family intramembrane serine protease [Phycisphaerales bacterium]|tara:strand:- start:467 stop:1621 length:1155 start_codon:yes stop_codon:yes gene_type:complete
MFILLGTDLPRDRRPVVTETLIVLMMLAYLAVLVVGALDQQAAERLISGLALSARDFHWWQVITYQFTHDNPLMGGTEHPLWRLLHLGFNMMGLWVFGSAIESRMGRVGFAIFVLMGGIVAGLAHIATSQNPVIGASGAVCALVGGFLILFPRCRIRVLVIFFLITFWMAPALLIISIWVALDLIGWVGLGDSGTAYAAHIGGYLWGLGTALALLPTPVFKRDGTDAVALLKHRHRRQVLSQVTAGPRPATAPREATVEPAAAFVSAVRGHIAQGNLDSATSLWCRLATEHEAAVLPEKDQLTLANHLQATGKRFESADAYRRYLERYSKSPSAGEVRLLLGLLLVRFLGQGAEAIPLLEQAKRDATTDQRRSLAESLLGEAST